MPSRTQKVFLKEQLESVRIKDNRFCLKFTVAYKSFRFGEGSAASKLLLSHSSSMQMFMPVLTALAKNGEKRLS